MGIYSIFGNESALWALIARRSGQSKAHVRAVWQALLDQGSAYQSLDCDRMDKKLKARAGTCKAIVEAMADLYLVNNGRIIGWVYASARRNGQGQAGASQARTS